jgi:tetratricopeptide (TPR) repeat protein
MDAKTKISKISFLLSLFLFCTSTYAQDIDSLSYSDLDKMIIDREQFEKKKDQRINLLKEDLERKQLLGDSSNIYKANLELYKEYKSYKYDSAYYFLTNAKDLAIAINDSSKLARSRINEGFILLSAGLFKEAADTLQIIRPETLIEEDKYQYYYTYARLYFDLADYNDDKRFQIDYVRKGIALLKESLKNCPPNSSRYWQSTSLIKLKEQNWKGAEAAYLKWIENFDLNPNLYAIATSSLSYIYDRLGNDNLATKYLILAAISDIKSATKENTALRNLANKLFQKGNLKKANHYVKIALDDANFYDARHRKNQISSILPIIESAQLLKVEQKNKSLRTTVYLLAILTLITLIFIGLTFKQLKEKKIARKELAKNNERLKKVNLSLLESDTIKQDYITYFLRITSHLIGKIESLQKTTILKIQTKKADELLKMMKNYSVKQERVALFHQFDEVFLQLFPDFIESFNKLFPEDQQRQLKKEELLNTELRIFALYRLGIQDNKQIADFLDVSLSTVYSYKTRLKSSSNYRDSFEQKVMEIKRL